MAHNITFFVADARKRCRVTHPTSTCLLIPSLKYEMHRLVRGTFMGPCGSFSSFFSYEHVPAGTAAAACSCPTYSSARKRGCVTHPTSMHILTPNLQDEIHLLRDCSWCFHGLPWRFRRVFLVRTRTVLLLLLLAGVNRLVSTTDDWLRACAEPKVGVSPPRVKPLL